MGGGGGGGGLLGGLLSVASFFVPELQIVSQVFNTINAVANDNPLGAAMGAFSIASPGAGSGGLTDLFTGDNTNVYSGPLDDWSSNATGGGLDGWITDPTTGLQTYSADAIDTSGLQDQINSGVEGAQAAAGDAQRLALQEAIASGSRDAGIQTLDNLYGNKNFNYDALKDSVNLNTEGGFAAAKDTITGMDQALPELEGTKSGLQTLFQTPGITQGADGVNTAALGTGQVNALSDVSGVESSMNPDMTGSNSGNYTGGTPVQSQPTTLEGMNTYESNYGSNNYTPDYGNLDDANKAINAGNGGGIPEGYGMPASGSIPGMDTLGSTNKLTTAWNTKSIPGMGGNNMGPYEAILKGAGGLDSWYRNKKAMEMLRGNPAVSGATIEQLDRVESPNLQRGTEANNMWTQNFKDPKQAFAEYMDGAGGNLARQTAAKAAAAGKRGSYLNSGRMNSDLYSAFLSNLNNRGNALSQGFYNPQLGARGAVASAGVQGSTELAKMMRNSNAPIFDAAANIGKGLEGLWS